MSSKAAQARYDKIAAKKQENAKFCDSLVVYDYIKEELARYINVRSAQLENRIADRITACKANGWNPLDYAYLESQETVNFKTATYFRWEKIT